MTLYIDIAILIVGLLGVIWLNLHPEFGCPPRRMREDEVPDVGDILGVDAYRRGVLTINEARARLGDPGRLGTTRLLQ